MKDKQKGSALLWAIVVVMVLSITVAAALTISYSYYNRAVQNNNQRQAYLTSKGVIEDLVEKIKADDETYTKLFDAYLEDGGSTRLNIQLPEEQKMGTCVGEITVNDPKDKRGYITITITSEYANQTGTVKADLQLGNIDGILHWQLLRYYEGEPLTLAKYTSIVEAENMWQMMDEINTIYDSNSKNFCKVSAILMADDEKYQYYLAHRKNQGWFYNNDILREFFFYGYYEEKLPYLTEDDLGDEVPDEIKDYVRNNKLRIEPYFTYSTYRTCIVFASPLEEFKNGNWSSYVRLIYNPDDDHWYYLNNAIGLAGTFNNTNAEEMDKKWKDFVDTVLKNPDKATRLE